jgi:hypothetical protein
MANLPIAFAESVESTPHDEGADIERIMDILQRSLQMHFQQSGQKHRDVHVKAHGSAHAQFSVLPGLPDELAQGLFAREATYSAWVRFSNAAPWRQADALPDARGLAIQVENVPGERIEPGTTQDFVMVNHPVFIAADVKAYLRLETARLQARDRIWALPASIAREATALPAGTWRGLVAAGRVLVQCPTHPADYNLLQYGSHPLWEFRCQVSRCS